MTQLLQNLSTVSRSVSRLPPSSFYSDQKFGGILASGERDYESGSGSSNIVVGATTTAVSFREAYGRSGSESDNASGVGYDPPDDSRDLDLGFLNFSLQALIPVNSSWKGLLAIVLCPLFAALKDAVGVFSLRVLKAYTC